MDANSRYKYGVVACVILGSILLASGIGKLFVNLPTETEFLQNLSPAFSFPPIIKQWIPYVLPWGEVFVGVLLLVQVGVVFVVLFGCVPLILSFIVNNYWMITSGKEYETCNYCFGALEIMLGSLTPAQALALDIFMFILCCVIIFTNTSYPLLYGALRKR